MSNSCAVPCRRVDQEPQAILPNRSAHRGADVVIPDERCRRRARRFEFVGEVGTLQRLRAPTRVEAAVIELPPVRGTMFSTGPPVSVSPSAPPTVTEISCEFRESEK